MDLTQCAAAYSLTEALQSVTTAAVSSTDTASVPSSAAVSTTAKSSSATSTKAGSAAATSSTSAYVAPTTSNVVGTGGLAPTSTKSPQFTGAAAPNAGLGGAVGGLVLAAGALLL